MYRNILRIIKHQYIKLYIISASFAALQLPIDIFNEDIKHIGIDNFDKKWSYFFIIVIFSMTLVIVISSIKYYKEIVILSSWKTKILTQNEIKELRITKKISVIGLSNSGKTTFINRITHKNPSNVKTQAIEGKILCIDHKMLCFIDISGENLAQQMRAIELADLVILFIDHSESSESMIIKKNRIIETRNLLKRIKEHLEVSNQKIIPSIVLMNKKDLWAKTKSKEEDLISEYSDISNKLGEIFQKESKLYHYSNFTNKKVKSEELRNIVDYILEKLGV